MVRKLINKCQRINYPNQLEKIFLLALMEVQIKNPPTRRVAGVIRREHMMRIEFANLRAIE
jgi:hypothetical protein